MASVPRPAAAAHSAAGGATPAGTAAHPDIHAHRILILDFGAQYTQLIARRVRELGVYCEIHPWDMGDAGVRAFGARGVILSGGPETVTTASAPRAPAAVYELGVPVLGICYGMQTMAQQLGGRVAPGTEREFGYAEVTVSGASRLLDELADRRNPAGRAVLDVWMSHGDRVDALPPGFSVTAATGAIPFAAMSDERRRFYGVQFHPEVTHTTQGTKLLERFVREICGADALWSVGNIIEDAIARLRAQVGHGKVLLGLSGGVDSSVVAALLHRAIGEQLLCVFVDHGLLRLGEAESVMSVFAQHLGAQVIRVDAQARFLGALAGITDPEAKRKVIGRTFVEVFDEQAQRLLGVEFLAQARSIPTSSSRPAPAPARRRSSSRTTTWGASPRGCASSSSSRCASCSRTRCAGSAPSSGCRASSPIATPSPDRGSRCGSSARCAPSTPSSCGARMRSTSRSCAGTISTIA